MEQDATMARIGRGMELSQRGERTAARGLFAEVWNDIGGCSGEPFHRCTLAHAMADLQDDVHQELVWDLRALDAADLITDKRAAQAGVTIPGPPSIRRYTSTLVSATARSMISTFSGSRRHGRAPIPGSSAAGVR